MIFLVAFVILQSLVFLGAATMLGLEIRAAMRRRSIRERERVAIKRLVDNIARRWE